MKKPSYPRKRVLPLIRKKTEQTNDEDEALKDKATSKGLLRKWRTIPKKAWEPQSSSRSTTIRKTTTLFASTFHPLTASVSQVLREVRNKQFLRWPTQMKSDPATRDNSKYCEFHRDYGHRKDDCIQPKREIEYLIRRGYLRRFISLENQA